MPRLSQYSSAVPVLEKKHFMSVVEAKNYFKGLGYSESELDRSTVTTQGDEIHIMVSKRNPRDYVEIIRSKFRDVNTVRHFS